MNKLYVSASYNPSPSQIILKEGVQVFQPFQPWSGLPDYDLKGFTPEINNSGFYVESLWWSEVPLEIKFLLDPDDSFMTNKGVLCIDYVVDECRYLTHGDLKWVKYNGAYYVPKAGTHDVWKYSHHRK